MSSRIGVPGYSHESLLLPIYQRHPQSLSGFLGSSRRAVPREYGGVVDCGINDD